MNDLVSDMLARIKNAAVVGRASVYVPYSKLNLEIAQTLVRKEYITSTSRKNRKGRPVLELIISYDENGEPRFDNMRRVSRLSRRFYRGIGEIKPLTKGSYILTTSKGVLTDAEAREKHVGGEVLLRIW